MTTFNKFNFISSKQLGNLRDQINTEASRHREIIETTANRLRNEEIQKSTVEERLEKTAHDLHYLKNEHMTVNRLKFFQFNFFLKTQFNLLFFYFKCVVI